MITDEPVNCPVRHDRRRQLAETTGIERSERIGKRRADQAELRPDRGRPGRSGGRGRSSPPCRGKPSRIAQQLGAGRNFSSSVSALASMTVQKGVVALRTAASPRADLGSGRETSARRG